MTKSTFLQQLKLTNDSKILFLCIEHMLDKIHKDDDKCEETYINEFFSNYKNYHRYLNEDIQKQTIIHFDEKLVDIKNSSYYTSNIVEFKTRVEKLYKNITLVKNALGIKI